MALNLHELKLHCTRKAAQYRYNLANWKIKKPASRERAERCLARYNRMYLSIQIVYVIKPRTP